MNSRTIALALAVGLPAAFLSSPVMAAQQKPAQAGPKLNLSKEARAAIVELSKAVEAKDAANIPAKLSAAQAAAKNPDDRFAIAQLQLNAALASNSDAQLLPAIEAMLATGRAEPGMARRLQLKLAALHYAAKQYDKAAIAAEQALASDANDADALVLLAESRSNQGRPADAVSALQRAIRARSAAGQKPDESWYKRALGIAYEAKLPSTVDIAREWLVAYPSTTSWRDAIRIYRNLNKEDAASRLDAFRLARLTNALDGDADYQLYAYDAADAYALAEARALLDEAKASGKMDASKAAYKEVAAYLKSKPAVDKATLAQSAKSAASDPSARFALRMAEAHYGIGEYARAAELYRLALGKNGADKDLVNLRLGAALVKAGDKPGATAAFSAVAGPRAALAKLWLHYLATAA